MNKSHFKYIGKKIDDIFRGFASSLIGYSPKGKKIIFSPDSKSLINLFVQALGNTHPNKKESDTLKLMLESVNGYVDALKEKTKANTFQDLFSYTSQAKINNTQIKPEDIQNIISQNLDKAQNHLKLIANAETNKARNIGKALVIAKIAEERGDSRPMAYFNPILDDRNDPETYRLHLLPDKVTPRIYFLDEIENKYHKKGDKWPKLVGTNPNCRCILTPYQIGYGWEGGKLVYKGEGHNELEEQRKQYGMP